MSTREKWILAVQIIESVSLIVMAVYVVKLILLARKHGKL
jgi:hypothetical protein